jgi:hypothetical protein
MDVESEMNIDKEINRTYNTLANLIDIFFDGKGLYGALISSISKSSISLTM